MPSAVVAENKIFQALSDPNRRAIFVSLTPSDAAVKDLTTRFDISQPAVSQHLAMLTGAGLLIDRREGAASTCRWKRWNEAAHRLDRALPGFLDGARRSP